MSMPTAWSRPPHPSTLLAVPSPATKYPVSSAMRLLDTETGQFVEADPRKTKYAILSHTWDPEGEQTHEELKKIQQRYKPWRSESESDVPQNGHPGGPTSDTLSSISGSSRLDSLSPEFTHVIEPPSKLFHHSIWDDPELSQKVREACAVARKNGYRYIWIDSCCIDKTSSSELSEAINSMYKWYDLAAVCYAYLADVPPGTDPRAERSHFRRSRWFTRGWTLQELLAPRFVEFLSEDWAPIGSKHTLVDLIETITKIDYKALLQHQGTLDKFSIAQRLSWAANRETTREEDRAYSLLGIFDINMPTLYGEGDRAFRRLQEQIMQRVPDQSLIAWGDVYLETRLPENPDPSDTRDTLLATACRYNDQRRNILAPLPDYFKNCEYLCVPRRECLQLLAPQHRELEYTSTPYGIRTHLHMIPLTPDLLLRAIPDSKDIQLKFNRPDPHDNYQWYLAILGCEHSDRPGFLLGRVCYIPFSYSDVEFVYTGTVDVSSRGNLLCRASLFPLLSDTVKSCRPQTEVKTVYIRHPDRPDSSVSLLISPYTSIQLVLLKETREALDSQGYSAELRHPNSDYPTTHLLTLSALNGDHTITIEFRHTLEDGGRRFTIEADVAMSTGFREPLESFSQRLDPDLLRPDRIADPASLSWLQAVSMGWGVSPVRSKIELGTVGGAFRAMAVHLLFVGAGVYILRIFVDSVKMEAEGIEESLPSGEVDTEDEAGRAEEPGGQ
ncbi:hypothetical protein V8D89_014365 [Ganoderma adspersum]